MTNDDKEKESSPAAATPEKKQTTTTPSSPDLSPNAMVQAAVANAMQQQQKKKQNKEDDHSMEEDMTNKKRPRYYEDDYLQPMENIWSHQQKKGNREEAIQETWKLMTKYVDELIQDGIFAHQEWERTQQKLNVEQEDSAAKTRELGRLASPTRKLVKALR